MKIVTEILILITNWEKPGFPQKEHRGPPVVNFINILRAFFGADIFAPKKISNQRQSFVIFGVKISYEKRAR